MTTSQTKVDSKDYKWYWSGVFFALGMSIAILGYLGDELSSFWLKAFFACVLVGYSFLSWYAAGSLLTAILIAILNSLPS